MILRATIAGATLSLALLACKGPEVRPSDTTTIAPAVAATVDSAFVPADTAVAAVDSSSAVPAKAPPAEVPSQTKTKSPGSTPKASSSTTATKVASTPARDTQPPVVTRETTAVVTPPAPQLAEPTPLALRDSGPKAHPAYGIGEVLEYQVKFGSISVGKATLEVVGLDTIRGIPAMHIRLRVEGKLGFLSVKDFYESWFDPRTMSSLRYTQDIDEANYERVRHYEIYPERKTYHEKGKKELPSVAAPLDDASFLFFLRTIPLAVGQSYSFDRYFKPDRNPVRVSVLRKESVKVPAGTFSTVVVRPIIKSTGLFSEGGKAEVWFSDDESHLLVQLKTQMRVGSLNLFLRKVKKAPGTTAAP